MILLLAAGCAPQDIDRTYGKRRGAVGGQSVNGTAVLGEMFARAGHTVRSWRRLSPKLEESQIIVWAPDDFHPPTSEQRAYLEDWLAGEDQRTLIYIGRDFDAAIGYWRRVDPPAEQVVEVARRQAVAQAAHEAARSRVELGKNHDWFTLQRVETSTAVDTVGGPWAAGIDAAELEMELATQLVPANQQAVEAWVGRNAAPWSEPPTYSSLLNTDGKDLVTRIEFENGSRLFLVANGSFLLNLPLVNQEHRKLAAELVSACGPRQNVVFLESGAGGPLILEQEPNADYPTGLEIFTVWPLGIIMLHFAAVGILFCIAVFPIFGRPHALDDASPSDFGKHIIALGELLARTRDRQYAVDRVRYYHEHVRRDSGLSHRRESTRVPLPAAESQQPEPSSRKTQQPERSGEATVPDARRSDRAPSEGAQAQRTSES